MIFTDAGLSREETSMGYLQMLDYLERTSMGYLQMLDYLERTLSMGYLQMLDYLERRQVCDIYRCWII